MTIVSHVFLFNRFIRIYLFLLDNGNLTVLEINTGKTTVYKDNVLESMPKPLLDIFLIYFKHISV